MKKFKSPSIHRTPLYRAKAAYWGMLYRCEDKVGKNPSYKNVKLKMTKDEWIAWAVPKYEEFDNNFPNESPSVSRFGDVGDYEISNIEIIPQKKNREKQRTTLLVREDGLKLCCKCREDKLSIEFSRNRRNKDGLHHYCKLCSKEEMRAWRNRKRTSSSIGRAALS